MSEVEPLPPAAEAASSARLSTGMRLAFLAVASALFMEFIDSTALSTALPTLADAFHADPVHLKLALTSYILALAVFIPISGWAAERFGARRVFITAMAVFLAGSALCGLSRTLPELVGARIVQGMGGAMMTPVARLIVVSSTPKEHLIRGMAWFTMPALVGPLIGPPLAGFVLSVADWPWIFYLNMPIGLIGMAAVMRWVPPLKRPNPGPFDWGGFLLSSAAIVGVVAVAETAGMALIPRPMQVALVLAAIGALVAYVVQARGKRRPILDLSLLRLPTYRAGIMGGLFVRLGVGAGPFLMPLLLQIGLGWTPLQQGSVTLASGLGVLGARPFVAASLKRIGFRKQLVGSVLIVAVLVSIPGFFRTTTPPLLIMALLFAAGFARANQFIAANTIAYADVPENRIAAASTLSAVLQQVGLALGVSFGGMMLHIARGSGGTLTADHFVIPYLAVGAVTLLAAPVYMRLHPEAGAIIAGHRRRA